jgi:hypothetical protein
MGDPGVRVALRTIVVLKNSTPVWLPIRPFPLIFGRFIEHRDACLVRIVWALMAKGEDFKAPAVTA